MKIRINGLRSIFPGGVVRSSTGKSLTTSTVYTQLRRAMYTVLERMGVPKDDILRPSYQLFKEHYIEDAWKMKQAGLGFTLEKIPYNGHDEWRGDLTLDSKEPPYGILVVPVSPGRMIAPLERGQMKRLYISIASAYKIRDLQIVDKVVLHKLIEGFVTGKVKSFDIGNCVQIINGVRQLSYCKNYPSRRHAPKSDYYQYISVICDRKSRDIGIIINPMNRNRDGGKLYTPVIQGDMFTETDFFA